jgi:hypothetical protein
MCIFKSRVAGPVGPLEGVLSDGPLSDVAAIGGVRIYEMGFGKSLRGLLLPCGNVKVTQRRLFPVNLFDVSDSQLRYINVSAEGKVLLRQKRIKCSPHLLLPKLNPGTVGLQMSRSSPFTSDGSIPLHLAGTAPLRQFRCRDR